MLHQKVLFKNSVYLVERGSLTENCVKNNFLSPASGEGCCPFIVRHRYLKWKYNLENYESLF